MSSPQPASKPEATAPKEDQVDPFTIANDPHYSEADWYTKVYKGDTEKQLTFRAILMGGLLGMLMSASNLYTTLKVGWSFGVAITSCVLSYVIWNGLRALSGHKLSRMTLLENNCMQSTASAAGYSTGATLATAFGTLLLIEGHHQPWLIVITFTLFTALLGVFIAVPMKRQMVNQEKLPFPSGIAAATTLRSLYSEGKEAIRKAYVLVGCLGAGMIVGVLKAPEGAIGWLDRILNKLHIRIPDLYPAAGFWQLNGKQLLGFGFDPSVLLVGAGMIMGLRAALSMFIGAVILYLFVGPWIISLDIAHAADIGYKISIPLVGGGTVYHLPRWALWGGTSLMVFTSLATIAMQWETIARAVSGFLNRNKPKESSAVDAIIRRAEVPVSWLVIGLIPATIGLLFVQYLAFHISFWLGLIAVAVSFFLSLVASRATGETDTTPIGAMGKVMQLIFAVLSPGNIQHNVVSAGVAANAASSSADLLTDLKSGYMLGANPRKQFIAQLIGVFFGTIAVVPAWYLMVPNKEVLEAFNPPSTNMWKAVAELLAGGGFGVLPQSAIAAIVVGGLIGAVIPIIGRLRPSWGPYMPSAMGLGLSWVFQYSNSQSFAIGALIVWFWTKLHAKSADAYAIPAASGLIAGESLAAAAVAIIATLGSLAW
jgi:putative OPT family oligopeptide transporter